MLLHVAGKLFYRTQRLRRERRGPIQPQRASPGPRRSDRRTDPARVDLARFGGTVPAATSLGRGGFTGNSWEEYAFKTPQLYNLKDSRFFGHGSSFSTIRQVVEYYNAGVKQNVNVRDEKVTPLFRPLSLSPDEVDSLVAFLEDGLYDPNMPRYAPTAVGSGLCFPDNDSQSQIDLGCTGSSMPSDRRMAGRRLSQ